MSGSIRSQLPGLFKTAQKSLAQVSNPTPKLVGELASGNASVKQALSQLGQMDGFASVASGKQSLALAANNALGFAHNAAGLAQSRTGIGQKLMSGVLQSGTVPGGILHALAMARTPHQATTKPTGHSGFTGPMAQGIAGAVSSLAHGAASGHGPLAQAIASALSSLAHGATSGPHGLQHGTASAVGSLAHGVASGHGPLAQGLASAVSSLAHGATGGPHGLMHGAASAVGSLAHGAASGHGGRPRASRAR
ncbi:hypothetical protein ACN28S_20880 [Cystobacter fuscus]